MYVLNNTLACKIVKTNSNFVICTYICTYACMYVCMHVYVSMCVCMHACMYAYACMVYVCMHVHVCIYLYMYVSNIYVLAQGSRVGGLYVQALRVERVKDYLFTCFQRCAYCLPLTSGHLPVTTHLGVCVQCTSARCTTAFHVTCGWTVRAHFSISSGSTGQNPIVVSCVKHSRPKPKEVLLQLIVFLLQF